MTGAATATWLPSTVAGLAACWDLWLGEFAQPGGEVADSSAIWAATWC